MAYLNKRQYDYRRESAACRNLANEEIAVANGMSENDASLVSELCSVRHDFHSDMDMLVKSTAACSELIKRIMDIEGRINTSSLPPLDIVSILGDIDDMDGLIYDYGDDVPEDHNSEEFQNWYDENFERVYDELSEINKSIEKYIDNIDKKYNTTWCPSGALRR